MFLYLVAPGHPGFHEETSRHRVKWVFFGCLGCTAKAIIEHHYRVRAARSRWET
jgi:hypothetical protein